MISLFNKKSIIGTVVVFSLVLMVGCSSTPKPISSDTNSDKNTNKAPSISTTKSPVVADGNSSPNVVTNDSKSNLIKSQETILNNIKKLAQQGKIINCDFAVDSMVIDDVIKKWGEPDKTVYVGTAKGSYSTYSKHNVVFGWNKGSRLFEVRSFDKSLTKISLSMTKKVFGTPAYNVKSGRQVIIGYVASKDYKILLVFPQPTSSIKDPLMDHYSVIYPKGTVNNMASDPGREW